MEITLIIKLILMIAFFLEVLIFGKFISNLNCFSKGNIMSLAMTFSGSLFLSIAMLDIIPEAIETFNKYFDEVHTSLFSSSNLHDNQYLPLTMIIASVTFMIIMYLDKILIGHSPDDQYEVSLFKEPRKTHPDANNSIEFKESDVENDQKINSSQLRQTKLEKINQNLNFRPQTEKKCDDNHCQQKASQNHKDETNYRPFILQAGMSIHAFFQCLAVGLQKTPIGILSLASAILVHKWAQGLTLGLIYRRQGYSAKTSTIMIIIQGCINVLGLISGASLIGQGNFVMAFFMSISAGTFLYISLAEVLFEQIQTMNKIKGFVIILANVFIGLLVGFEKYSEEMAAEGER